VYPPKGPKSTTNPVTVAAVLPLSSGGRVQRRQPPRRRSAQPKRTSQPRPLAEWLCPGTPLKDPSASLLLPDRRALVRPWARMPLGTSRLCRFAGRGRPAKMAIS